MCVFSLSIFLERGKSDGVQVRLWVAVTDVQVQALLPEANGAGAKQDMSRTRRRKGRGERGQAPKCRKQRPPLLDKTICLKDMIAEADQLRVEPRFAFRVDCSEDDIQRFA